LKSFKDLAGELDGYSKGKQCLMAAAR